MSKIKRGLYMTVMILALLICCIPVSVHAADYYTEGYFKYTLAKDHVEIESYFGSEGEVVIPDHIAGQPVTKIGGKTFDGNTTVTSITIPETVTTVDGSTFSGLTQLRKLIVQSKSVSVSAPANCIVVEDYPEYVDNGKNNSGSDNTKTDDNKKNDNKKNDSSNGNTPTNKTNKNNGFESASGDTEKSNRYDTGIRTKDKSLITVDDSGHLISLDKDNNIKVLDRKHKYTLSVDKDGKAAIKDEDGNKVKVDKDKNTVTFKDADGKDLVLNTDGERQSNLKMILAAVAITVIVVAIGAVLLIREHRKARNDE